MLLNVSDLFTVFDLNRGPSSKLSLNDSSTQLKYDTHLSQNNNSLLLHPLIICIFPLSSLWGLTQNVFTFISHVHIYDLTPNQKFLMNRDSGEYKTKKGKSENICWRKGGEENKRGMKICLFFI